jgi:surface polysaccharide O-acyltransferase-like enzyme
MNAWFVSVTLHEIQQIFWSATILNYVAVIRKINKTRRILKNIFQLSFQELHYQLYAFMSVYRA